MPREPQTNPLRKRKRGKVFTAADSTPIQARIPNAMFLEIERAARHELVSVADFVRAALLEKLERERNKNEVLIISRCSTARNCCRIFTLRRNDTFCRNHICILGRVCAWICRSRIHFLSTAPSRKTTTLYPMNTPALSTTAAKAGSRMTGGTVHTNGHAATLD